MTKTRDRLERYAQCLWRRWYRAAGYAQKTSAVDALLRYRLQNPKEVRIAFSMPIGGDRRRSRLIGKAMVGLVEALCARPVDPVAVDGAMSRFRMFMP